MPLVTALSNAFIAFFKANFELSALAAARDSSKRRIVVRNADLMRILRRVRFLLVLTLLIADLMLGKHLHLPNSINFIMLIKKMQQF